MGEVRDEERHYALLRKQRQKALFNGLLEECQQSGYLSLNSSSKYYLCSKKLAQRDYKKFIAVDEKDRDEFFQDFIDDLFKKERDDKSNQFQESVKALKIFLEGKFGDGESGEINVFSRWKEVNDIFQNEQVWS